MTDIVESLRVAAKWPYNVSSPNEPLLEEAEAEIERLRAALRRIDKMEVYEADAAVVLWAKIGIMRDIARAALHERT